MPTVANIWLVILAVRCAIVQSQYDSAQHINETSPGNTAQRLALIVDNQQQLLKKVIHQDAIIEQLRRTFGELQNEFDCHFPPYHSCTCTR